MVPEIVDPHVHHWQPEVNPWYPLLSTAMPAIAHNYTAEQYRADSLAWNITEIVHVAATVSPHVFLDEQRWLDAMADSTGWPRATVATVDPKSEWPVIKGDLAHLRKSPLLRGLRVLYDFDPSSETAANLVAELVAGDLVFDLVAHPDEVPAYLRLLDTVPELTVVVEHACWPRSVNPDYFAEWQRAVGQLAARPNTYMKISGLGMELHSLALEVQRPWIETCVSEFGADRSMFASNFPVDKLFGSFDELYGTYQTIAAELSDDAQRALFSGTARRVYRL